MVGILFVGRLGVPWLVTLWNALHERNTTTTTTTNTNDNNNNNNNDNKTSLGALHDRSLPVRGAAKRPAVDAETGGGRCLASGQNRESMQVGESTGVVLGDVPRKGGGAGVLLTLVSCGRGDGRRVLPRERSKTDMGI